MNELTKNQRAFAEANHNLVNVFLRRNRLKFEEYYDVVVFGFLKAVQSYHEKPNCAEYDFKTIAAINMRESLYSHWRYNGRKKRKADLISLNVCLNEGQNLILADTIPSVQEINENMVLNRMGIKTIMIHLSAREKNIVKMKADGFTAFEIGCVLGCSEHGINTCLYRMRKRLKQNGFDRFLNEGQSNCMA